MSKYGSVQKFRGGSYAGYLNDAQAAGGGGAPAVEQVVNLTLGAGITGAGVPTLDGADIQVTTVTKDDVLFVTVTAFEISYTGAAGSTSTLTLSGLPVTGVAQSSVLTVLGSNGPSGWFTLELDGAGNAVLGAEAQFQQGPLYVGTVTLINKI